MSAPAMSWFYISFSVEGSVSTDPEYVVEYGPFHSLFAIDVETKKSMVCHTE